MLATDEPEKTTDAAWRKVARRAIADMSCSHNTESLSLYGVVMERVIFNFVLHAIHQVSVALMSEVLYYPMLVQITPLIDGQTILSVCISFFLFIRFGMRPFVINTLSVWIFAVTSFVYFFFVNGVRL